MSTGAIRSVYEAVCAVIIEEIGNLDEHRAMFAPAIDRLCSARPAEPPPANPLAVVNQWLPSALEGLAGPSSRALDGHRQIGARLADAGSASAWRRAYDELPPSPDLDAYREHYAWLPLAAPPDRSMPAPFVAGDALVGLSLQAPGVTYPHHHHEAAELYGVLCGPIDWQVGDGPWTTMHPGDTIVHRPSESHSMRTGDHAALCWALWPDRSDSVVVMPSMDPNPASTPKVYG
ncbi:MAG: dimethylsulfonioproprionate lyase family protein [Actinomycetota bacterium]